MVADTNITSVSLSEADYWVETLELARVTEGSAELEVLLTSNSVRLEMAVKAALTACGFFAVFFSLEAAMMATLTACSFFTVFFSLELYQRSPKNHKKKRGKIKSKLDTCSLIHTHIYAIEYVAIKENHVVFDGGSKVSTLCKNSSCVLTKTMMNLYGR